MKLWINITLCMRMPYGTEKDFVVFGGGKTSYEYEVTRGEIVKTLFTPYFPDWIVGSMGKCRTCYVDVLGLS